MTSDARGFYMFCSVPTVVPLEVQGALGEEQSERYEVRIGLDQTAELLAIEIQQRR